MKNLTFEKISSSLTKEEMNVVTGGWIVGQTEGQDTYTGHNLWTTDHVVNGTDQYGVK
ncbi:MAG: hypothetical protein JWP12_519 [Bacteroidetes bacterium]|nr:hypothetical protein [Bacteroidota bacterium]